VMIMNCLFNGNPNSLNNFLSDFQYSFQMFRTYLHLHCLRSKKTDESVEVLAPMDEHIFQSQMNAFLTGFYEIFGDYNIRKVPNALKRPYLVDGVLSTISSIPDAFVLSQFMPGSEKSEELVKSEAFKASIEYKSPFGKLCQSGAYASKDELVVESIVLRKFRGEVVSIKSALLDGFAITILLSTKDNNGEIHNMSHRVTAIKPFLLRLLWLIIDTEDFELEMRLLSTTIISVNLNEESQVDDENASINLLDRSDPSLKACSFHDHTKASFSYPESTQHEALKNVENINPNTEVVSCLSFQNVRKLQRNKILGATNDSAMFTLLFNDSSDDW